MIKFNIPYISNNEISFIKKAIRSGSFTGNNHFSKLCEDFLTKKYGFSQCYLTPSCTSAIEMASLILDLKPNDEIIVPSYTFASCPNPFLMQGIKVVFADCEPTIPNISPKSIAKLISKKTKAIMMMHYGGFACDVEKIQAICKKNKLFLIEDAAQCINAFYKNKPLGSFGDIGVFSFHETKNIHCGEGGLIAVNNPHLLEKAETIRQYGTNRTAFLENKITHYESVGIGLSFFQSEINAAFLYAQLQDIDIVTKKRKELWLYYFDALEKINTHHFFSLPKINKNYNLNYHTFFIVLNDKSLSDKLINHLNTHKINAVKHFYPLHLSKLHQDNCSTKVALKNVEKFNNSLVRLPLHFNLTFKEIDFMVEKIALFFNLK